MFEALRNEILQCNACEAAFGYEPHPIVFGCKNAKIVQISQAPSSNVHRTLRPFDDASGRRLRNEWYGVSEETFYNPENFFITALAHCYPGKSPSGGDRPPPKRCARMWLSREIDLVENQIYILLGEKAASHFFPGVRYAELVFNDQTLNGKPAYVLPHPSPLNARWFKAHPEFLNHRVKAVRDVLQKVLAGP